MKELGRACRQEGIVFGSYYSNLDWYHPDWKPYEPQPGPLFEKKPDSPNLDRYLTYMRNQLTELIRDYGVEILQFDGEWPPTWTHEIGSRMYRDLRKLSPAVLLSSRIDKGRYGTKDPHTGGWNQKIHAGDYEERERYVSGLPGEKEAAGWADHAWQTWATIDRKQWAWNDDPELRTPEDIIEDLVSTVGSNGNYLINVAPRPDGSFHPDQIAVMDKVGAWLKANGESIYGTRGGPIRPADWGYSTRKGNTAYLHILKWRGDRLSLPPLGQRILSARLLGDRKPVEFRQLDAMIEIAVPAGRRDKLDTIVVLEFDRRPEMQK
jgi:alpha-L-fucosidase